jgi:hypothetical protein
MPSSSSRGSSSASGLSANAASTASTHRVAVADPLGVGRESGRVDRQVERGRQPAPQALAADRDLHHAVRAVEQP